MVAGLAESAAVGRGAHELELGVVQAPLEQVYEQVPLYPELQEPAAEVPEAVAGRLQLLIVWAVQGLGTHVPVLAFQMVPEAQDAVKEPVASFVVPP